jgi:hypothetical protein
MKRRTIRKRRVLKKISYKRRGRQVGGVGDNDIRDILNKIPWDVFVNSLADKITLDSVEYTRAEIILQSLLPKFNTTTELKFELIMATLLIGIISYHIQKKCIIIVKGGIAVQFLLATHGCDQTYSTNDLDLFIKPENTKYSARECANIIAECIVNAMNSIKHSNISYLDSSPFAENDNRNVVKLSVKKPTGEYIKFVDIGYSQPSIFTTLSTVVEERYGMQFRYYVPTMEVILMEKLRNLYLLREITESYQASHYKQSAMRSLISLSGCIRASDKRTIVRNLVYSMSFNKYKDEVEAKDYFNSLLQ